MYPIEIYTISLVDYIYISVMYISYNFTCVKTIAINLVSCSFDICKSLYKFCMAFNSCSSSNRSF